MRNKSPILALILLTLTMLMALPSPLLVPRVNAAVQAGQPTTWSPYGARTEQLLMTIYGDFQAMFTAFIGGEIDITDWPVQEGDENAFATNPDMYLTDGQAEFGIFEEDVNHGNSIFGVSMQTNRGADSFTSPSTKQTTAAGTEVRRALAHLLDKPDYIFANVPGLRGRADYVDIQAPPAQSLVIQGTPTNAINAKLPASILAEDCAAHPWFTPCDVNSPPVSAYNLVADSISGANFPGGHVLADRGYPGQADLRAACDHLKLAGAAPGTTDCDAVSRGQATIPAVGAQLNHYIRTHLPRRVAGQIITDAIEFLFDGRMVLYGSSLSEAYFTIGQVADIVFRTAPTANDWHLYTGGWFLGSTPDHLYALYHSQFASSACGGKRSTFAQNYVFYCAPEFDDRSNAGQFSATLAEAGLRFAEAAVVAHRNVMTIPFFSGAGQKFVALSAWSHQPGTDSSLISTIGHGFQGNSVTLYQMRAKPACRALETLASPPASLEGCYQNVQYAPGGGSIELVRRGLSQGTGHLSIYHAQTLWDFEIDNQIYDSMLGGNPLVAGAGAQIYDYMTTKHTQSFDPNTGITTQVWTLRPDLKWHDGVPVTAADVKWSIDSYKDVPSANLAPSVSAVLTTTVLSPRVLRVELTGQSAFHEGNIGGLPIVPRHVWEPLGLATLQDPGFDPMLAGKLVGSGPWVCKDTVTGAIGGSCAQNADGSRGGQDLTLGARVLFDRNPTWMRGPSNLQGSNMHLFSWADKNNDAKVDILDIADAALNFGVDNAYWDNKLFGVTDAQVDIVEIAKIASYFDVGLVKPQSPTTLINTNMDPRIDPYRSPGTFGAPSTPFIQYQFVGRDLQIPTRIHLDIAVIVVTTTTITWTIIIEDPVTDAFLGTITVSITITTVNVLLDVELNIDLGTTAPRLVVNQLQAAADDPTLKYNNVNNNGRFDLGTETLVQDNNLDGVFNAGDVILSGPIIPPGTLLVDTADVRFVDSNANGTRDSDETIFGDANNNLGFDAGDVVIRGSATPPGLLEQPVSALIP